MGEGIPKHNLFLIFKVNRKTQITRIFCEEVSELLDAASGPAAAAAAETPPAMKTMKSMKATKGKKKGKVGRPRSNKLRAICC